MTNDTLTKDIKQEIIKRGNEYKGGNDKKWRACSISFDLALLAISVDIDAIYDLLEAEGI
jgi:hypothetical protein